MDALSATLVSCCDLACRAGGCRLQGWMSVQSYFDSIEERLLRCQLKLEGARRVDFDEGLKEAWREAEEGQDVLFFAASSRGIGGVGGGKEA